MCSRPLNFTLSPKLHVPPPSPNYTLLYLFCWFFYLFVLRQVLTVYPWLVWSSLYRPGWPRIHLPVSTSGVLYLKAWATTSSLLNNLCKKVGIFSWNKFCVCVMWLIFSYSMFLERNLQNWHFRILLCATHAFFLEMVFISHTLLCLVPGDSLYLPYFCFSHLVTNIKFFPSSRVPGGNMHAFLLHATASVLRSFHGIN